MDSDERTLQIDTDASVSSMVSPNRPSKEKPERKKKVKEHQRRIIVNKDKVGYTVLWYTDQRPRAEGSVTMVNPCGHRAVRGDPHDLCTTCLVKAGKTICTVEEGSRCDICKELDCLPQEYWGRYKLAARKSVNNLKQTNNPNYVNIMEKNKWVGFEKAKELKDRLKAIESSQEKRDALYQTTKELIRRVKGLEDASEEGEAKVESPALEQQKSPARPSRGKRSAKVSPEASTSSKKKRTPKQRRVIPAALGAAPPADGSDHDDKEQQKVASSEGSEDMPVAAWVAKHQRDCLGETPGSPASTSHKLSSVSTARRVKRRKIKTAYKAISDEEDTAQRVLGTITTKKAVVPQLDSIEVTEQTAAVASQAVHAVRSESTSEKVVAEREDSPRVSSEKESAAEVVPKRKAQRRKKVRSRPAVQSSSGEEEEGGAASILQKKLSLKLDQERPKEFLKLIARPKTVKPKVPAPPPMMTRTRLRRRRKVTYVDAMSTSERSDSEPSWYRSRQDLQDSRDDFLRRACLRRLKRSLDADAEDSNAKVMIEAFSEGPDIRIDRLTTSNINKVCSQVSTDGQSVEFEKACEELHELEALTWPAHKSPGRSRSLELPLDHRFAAVSRRVKQEKPTIEETVVKQALEKAWGPMPKGATKVLSAHTSGFSTPSKCVPVEVTGATDLFPELTEKDTQSVQSAEDSREVGGKRPTVSTPSEATTSGTVSTLSEATTSRTVSTPSEATTSKTVNTSSEGAALETVTMATDVSTTGSSEVRGILTGSSDVSLVVIPPAEQAQLRSFLAGLSLQSAGLDPNTAAISVLRAPVPSLRGQPRGVMRPQQFWPRAPMYQRRPVGRVQPRPVIRHAHPEARTRGFLSSSRRLQSRHPQSFSQPRPHSRGSGSHRRRLPGFHTLRRPRTNTTTYRATIDLVSSSPSSTAPSAVTISSDEVTTQPSSEDDEPEGVANTVVSSVVTRVTAAAVTTRSAALTAMSSSTVHFTVTSSSVSSVVASTTASGTPAAVVDTVIIESDAE